MYAEEQAPTAPQTFGQWVRERMKEGGESGATLGTVCGLSRQMMWDISADRRQVSFEAAVRIARYYGFNPWSVLRVFDIVQPDVARILMDAVRVDPETGT